MGDIALKLSLRKVKVNKVNIFTVSLLGAICGSAQSMDLPAQSVDP